MLRVLAAFEREGLEYVLIGAAAMGLHGLVRATEDLDVFIRATPDNVARLKRAFRDAYAGDPNVDEICAADLLGDYPAVRYYPPSGDLYFDVITRLGEAASYDTVAAETIEVEGVRIRVATPRALFELKRGTVRPQDRQDAEGTAAALRAGGRLVAVQRFRSIEDMGAAPVLVPRGEGFERFVRHCARYWRLAPRAYPRGVFRFRSLEEAQVARECVTHENVQRQRRARRGE